MKDCLVGVSGGIDSLFAAITLKSQGFNVFALHLHLHSKEKMGDKVENILKKHNIEFAYLDRREEFKKYVVNYFTDEYSRGFTPNPCVICNRDVKLPFLYEEAIKIHISLIATGHYADTDEKGYIIRHSSKKDQSYFLACVDRTILKHTLFPLKDYTKKEIKDYLQLNNNIRESSDLCFIKNNYREDLKKKFGAKKGKIVKNTKIVGYHNGFYNYTIGQRKGIKIDNKPHYVVAIDAKRNIIYADEESKLYNNTFRMGKLKLLKEERFFYDKTLECMVRYKTQPKKCLLNIQSKSVELFDEERAITPGQIAVFYYNNKIVACGTIDYGIY